MVSINLSDSVATALYAQAQAEGLTVEAYLARVAVASPPVRAADMTEVEFDRLLDEVAVPGPESSSKYARADIYLDHA
jgi:hypothetical protein